jgi:hypothetical protein
MPGTPAPKRDVLTTELIQQGRHIAERILIGNDGAWPFIGGFYVAALVQAGRLEEARRRLASWRR